MQGIDLGFWEAVYNESANEIRLLVTGNGGASVLFSLNAGNIEHIMETLEKPETHSLVLMGQAIEPQNWMPMIQAIEDTDDGDGEEYGSFNYEVKDDDLSAFLHGPKRDFTLHFGEPLERRLLANSIWDHWATDHLLFQAGE